MGNMYKKLYGYTELPQSIKNQINALVNIWKKHLGDKLAGVYLHGSIALKAFNPESGDIDIIVVVSESPDVSTKLAIAKDIIKMDGNPRPLEISAITLADAIKWKSPGNCVFHYSDFWTEKYEQRFRDPAVEVYVADHEFPDADVTSYIRLIKQSGIVLYGKAIEETFTDVSDEDFWKAISAEIDEYDFHSYNARYLASNVLILGRILSFKATKKILSKYEGGLWMVENVPEDLCYLPERAMAMWFGEENLENRELPEEDLNRLKEYLISEIRKPFNWNGTRR